MEASQTFTYKDLFARKYVPSFCIGIGLLAAAFIAEHFATLYALSYAARPTSVYVGDLLLDNLPVINLIPVVVEGALWAIVLSLILVLWKPRKILFAMKAVALLIIVRAFFTSLTHIGIYPGQMGPGPGYIDAAYTYFKLQTGYFFSGHTSMPLMMAFIFWEERFWRYAYLALSVVFAVSVLLIHAHYSIDVFAAPFMAYGIFEFCRKIFPRDYALLRPKIESLSGATRDPF